MALFQTIRLSINWICSFSSNRWKAQQQRVAVFYDFVDDISPNHLEPQPIVELSCNTLQLTSNIDIRIRLLRYQYLNILGKQLQSVRGRVKRGVETSQYTWHHSRSGKLGRHRRNVRQLRCSPVSNNWNHSAPRWTTLDDLERPKRTLLQKRYVFWSPLHKFE